MLAQIDRKYFRSRPLKAVSRLISYVFFEGRPVTTRGQWINPFVFAFFEVGKRLPILKNVKSPIFILGSGRSGTTILGVALSMHKDVGFLNEPKALWHSVYANEDVIGSYSRSCAKYCLDDTDVSVNTIAGAQKLYGAYLFLSGSNRIVDKYPEMVFRPNFVKAIFPDAKFLFITRNGWQTCASIGKWNQRHRKHFHGEVHDWWGVNQRKWKLMKKELVPQESLLHGLEHVIDGLDRDEDMAAVEWIITMNQGLRLSKDYPEDCFILKYEDLALNPIRQLRAICQFCDLQNDDTFIKFSIGLLKPQIEHGPFELNINLIPIFENLMKRFDYT